MFKSYKELSKLRTFDERFEYLRIGGAIGRETFGSDRYLNQALYRSAEWKRVRDLVIIRDECCDLGIRDRGIFSRVTVHHINPISIDHVEQSAHCVLDLNNLICTSHDTHNAIHYGSASMLTQLPAERSKGDTSLWRIQQT